MYHVIVAGTRYPSGGDPGLVGPLFLTHTTKCNLMAMQLSWKLWQHVHDADNVG